MELRQMLFNRVLAHCMLCVFSLAYTGSVQAQITINPKLTTGIGDVIGNPIFLFRGYPDTLAMGEFTLYVEAYDKGGRWDAATKTYRDLSGIGRIRFTCQNRWWQPFDRVRKDAVFKSLSVRIVDSVREVGTEISIRDAATLGIRAKQGATVELMVPHIGDKAIDLSTYLNQVATVRRPAGIRVRFTGLTVSVAKAGATQGLVTEGVAAYPSELPVPEPPFSLNVATGFQLNVDTFTIFPKNPAIAKGQLVLPNSLTSGEQCRAATLDLGTFVLSAKCEFYKELPAANYGIFGVGNTTLGIEGRGYVVDFSSTLTYAPIGKPIAWKGVTLIEGISKGKPSGTVLSNIGYLQNELRFQRGIVESWGLNAVFNSIIPYRFAALQPLGYDIESNVSQVRVDSSAVASGTLQNCKITLPRKAVRQANDATVVVEQANLTIVKGMDLLGTGLVLPTNQGLYWGDFVKAGGGELKSFGVENVSRQVVFYFSAQPKKPFFPISTDGTAFNAGFIFTSIDSFNLQGATFSNPQLLLVNTPDVPGGRDANKPIIPATNAPVWMEIRRTDTKKNLWINVATEGVNCHIEGYIGKAPDIKLGDNNRPLYVGVDPFKVLAGYSGQITTYVPSPIGSILLQCVESAVFTCDFRASVYLPKPSDTRVAFKEMVFTSTANNAGGKVVFGANDSLKYWGLQLVPKPGFQSGGLISVKTGQIVITAAGLREKRHFEQPFWLTWGEIKANGAVGRLFFDFNSAGQTFDGFPFVHNAVALSAFSSSATDTAFLRVGGTAHFPFFGGDYLHIIDQYTPSVLAAPFMSRRIKLSDETLMGFSPTNVKIGGNWSDGLGVFNFDIAYSDATQDGFIGKGNSLLRYLTGGNIGSTLEMNSRGTCIRIGSDLLDQRGVSLGPVANVTAIQRIWGCVCIKNDAVVNAVVGGELTLAANASIAARAGASMSATLQITPAMSKLTLDGEAYMSLAASLDALVNGHIQLTLNTAQGFVEGEVQGKMRIIEGTLFSGNSLEAEGQANWHLGIDFHELQGMVKLRIMSGGLFAGGAGTDLGAGIYFGKNAPKNRAWVLLGNDPHFKFNTEALPDHLTGVYGFLHIKQGVSLFVVSGEYELFIGLGAFVLTPDVAAKYGGITPVIGLPYIVGNLGGRIHGEILGGLVSAGAYINLQIIGPYPFHFQGKVGLEGCVLWVACHSVDLTVGLNTARGFYIE